jgi:DNA-binding SARP family transcriptional activator
VVQPWGLPTHLHDGGLRHVTSDLERLEAALQAGDWDAVASAYTGRLGEGVDIDVVSRAADVLERRVLEGLREAASDAPPERAIALLDRLIELDPLHEEALHDLVVLLLRSGRRREARRRYRALADRLHADLGVAPSEATTRLIEQA